MRSSNWRDGETCDFHGRVGDAVAFNEDLERWCDLRESHFYPLPPWKFPYEKLSLRGFRWDRKHVVGKIKNMLALLHL